MKVAVLSCTPSRNVPQQIYSGLFGEKIIMIATMLSAYYVPGLFQLQSHLSMRKLRTQRGSHMPRILTANE